MKIKELQKSVNVVWSPEKQTSVLLAAGSAAQQLLDTSFTSSNPVLELYSLNLSDSSYDLELVGAQESIHKFHQLVWSPFDNSSQYPNGLIIGGCENGYLKIYNVSKILAGEEALIAQSDKHCGPVRTVDCNFFKNNLVASATADSEIYIWDINNLNMPMTPGQKTQPIEDVCNVAWNLQVQHILASTFSTRCVVWDLRKNEPIIKLIDSQSRVRWRNVQWHPDIATQIWLASEDDVNPVIQLWDLRYATAPSKTLQIHSRGILGMTLCTKDTELMISCAKDNKILCWNANSEDNHGKILSEVASTSQWYSDVTWCPRNPAIIAASNFDGNVSIYSIFGGTQHQIQTTNKIADSFPGMEMPRDKQIGQQSANFHTFHDLEMPPKWFMKRNAGVSFGFGGKFIMFKNNSNSIEIKQLVTDEILIEQSIKLENVLMQGNYIDYCCQKADEYEGDQHKRFIWYFLKAYFEENPMDEFLNLLGYQVTDIANKFSQYNETKDEHVDKITDQMRKLNHNHDKIETNEVMESATKVPYKLITTGAEGLICEALLTGNITAAVELCMNAGRSTDAIILASLGGSDLLAKTQYKYLKNNDSFISNLISAMVMADWSGVISQCTIDSWKEVLVAAITHSKDQAALLCERIGERMQIESCGDVSVMKNAILCYICAGNIERIVDAWNMINGPDSLNESKKLHELVEIVVILNKGIERYGQNNNVVYGKYAELLSRYAFRLAAQGSLEVALTYIGNSQDDQNIIELRNRLVCALGNKQQYQHEQKQNQEANLNFGRNIFSNIPPQMQNRSLSTSSTEKSSVAQVPIYNIGLPNSVLRNSADQNHMWPLQPAISNQTVSKPPIVSLTDNNGVYPPRPASGSSVSSQSAITTLSSGSHPKPKRVLDPSVQSNAGYGQVPPTIPYDPVSTSYNTNPMQASFNSQPISSMPIQQVPSSYDSLYRYQSSNSVPMNTNGSLAHSSSIPQNVQKNPTPPPGWNDPPESKRKTSQFEVFNKSAKHAGAKKWLQKHSDDYYSSKYKTDISTVAPITQPLLIPNQPSQVPAPLFPGMQIQNQHTADQNFQSLPQIYPVEGMNMDAARGYFQPPQSGNTVNYQNFNSFVSGSQQQFVPYAEDAIHPPPVEEETQKQKPPLPEEFIYLQTVFDELKTQCSIKATNPQMKRKLDDVSRRIESLYDLLRENKLSTNTLESLNQMVQLIQIGDYGNCLGLHTQMVSGPEFAKIATFMPGMKVLIQLAMQLQVYLR